MKYSLQIEIDYQEDRDNFHVQLINNWTGEIISTGEARKDRQAIISCLEYLINEHLPEPK